MSIVLNSACGGSITLNEPNTALNRVLELPNNSGTLISTGSTFAGNGPAFLASADGTQSVSNATFTKMLLPTESFDTASAFASNTFTPLVAGYYILSFVVNFSSTSGQMFCELRKNNSRFALGSIVPGTAIEGVSSGSALVYLNGSTDFVDLYGYQNSGGSATSRGSTYLSGALVRAA